MNTVPVSVEELKQFHTIDRDMYGKLIFSLHHDPLMSIRIMSFWLWLECSGNCRNFMSHLHSFPSLLLNSVVLETISCICYLDDSSILSLSNINVVGIPFLLNIIGNNTFSIQYLIDNRAIVLESMQKISVNVCSRAFDDLLSRILLQRHQYQTVRTMFHSGSPSSSSSRVLIPTDDRVQQHLISGMRPDRVQQHLMGGMEPRRNNIVSISEDPREQDIMTVDQTLLVTELVSPRSRMETQHERIVFLTFSKGYHVTETQLRDFFVGRFGEIIEDLIMQDVPLEEQPLYARMLVHSSNEVEKVLGGQNRVRFTINGKHVYGRKYVKRNPKATTSSVSHKNSPPPSPAAATTSE
ncbi:uncharacterized protein LOC124929618 [Impatiens glandulifera]|uniref:uncharacterized protein LOC124929618 n=1 Tax=Impatiens glandulifera TaxID=253017 RepID=UPI001FB051B3|nr:uncharacterized protein LOC124929618 [Impatiens glandulifera]